MATPITMRGLRSFGGFCFAGDGGSSATSGGDRRRPTSAVTVAAARRSLRALIAWGPDRLAGDIELVGATRGQMLANCAVHARRESPSLHTSVRFRHPSVDLRSLAGWELANGLMAMHHGVASRTRIRHAAKPDVGGRGVLRLR